MGWKTFNDRLALALVALLGGMLFFLAVKEPGLRDKILTLIGPWGTIIVMFYFRKKEAGSEPPK